MKIQENLFSNILSMVPNNDRPDIYDVDLHHIDALKNFSSVECHIILYPYSRDITSEDFEFTPFEEYANDIQSSQKSAYTPIKDSMGVSFGLLLGLVIVICFAIWKPQELLIIESIVSVIGAFIIGKELWTEIENALKSISKNWNIRYCAPVYSYQLEKHTTLSRYSQYAKKRRYGKLVLMPEKMDFIEKKNSQTLRLFFNMNDLKNFSGTSAHIMSIRIQPEKRNTLETEGYLLGIKLSINRKFLGFTRSREYFQSIDNGNYGCLDKSDEWSHNTLFFRNTLLLGRVKLFLKDGLLNGIKLLKKQF